jgi:hypothetical protein
VILEVLLEIPIVDINLGKIVDISNSQSYPWFDHPWKKQ